MSLRHGCVSECDWSVGQDDEINNQSQLVEKLREQVVELEELIVTHRKESESLQVEQQRVQAENDSAKDEACHHLLTYLLTFLQIHLCDITLKALMPLVELSKVIWHWCQLPERYIGSVGVAHSEQPANLTHFLLWF